MQRAALYARVSTDAQKQEGTIESQIAELKRQIAVASHVLVKEYIDDGYSGARMDRPGLDELRNDLKKDVFDAIYFLNTDRIARDVAYQTIIISELLKHKKQIIINGKDYVHNPENKFTLTVLGAVAELERAKIAERMMRGKLHRLRKGEITNNGIGTFGYDYVRKTDASPAALIINGDEAKAVRLMFEMAANGKGLCVITRMLEQRGIRTKTGKTLWGRDHVRDMLRNTTYAGTRYFNRVTEAKNLPDAAKAKQTGLVYRDRSEWVAITVPAIVSQELFDNVQKKLEENKRRYCQPDTHYLLSRLVKCGECGMGYSSYRRYVTAANGRTYHKSAYRCNWRAWEGTHDRRRIERCHNPEVATHLLEEKVWAMIAETMLDAKKLDVCIETPEGRVSHRRMARQVAKIEEEIKAVEEQKRRMMDLQASGRLGKEVLVDASRALDTVLNGLREQKSALVNEMEGMEEGLDLRIAEYCGRSKARFEKCDHFESKRQFLADHVDRVVYRRGKVTIAGGIAIASQGADAVRKLKFKIEGEIDKRAVRVNAGRKGRATLKLERSWQAQVTTSNASQFTAAAANIAR